MQSYFDRFPEKSKTELRTLTVLHGSNLPLEPGVYAFLEFYCPDATCDCQRVVIKVIREFEDRFQELATISYGWGESDALWAKLNAEFPNPFLDPLHPQSECSGFLLEFWDDMIHNDADYAERIKRHYDELRGAPSLTPAVAGSTATAADRRALRDKRRKRMKRRPR